MKFENTRVFNFEAAFRGMRNPKNSWDKSDSRFGMMPLVDFVMTGNDIPEDAVVIGTDKKSEIIEYAYIGPNDMKLAKTLINAGTEHRKFLRQIFVSVDISAPIFWWKEFDTYKIGTVANSTSTMHKLTSKPITIDCFETRDLDEEGINFFKDSINKLEDLRQKYLDTKDIKYWKWLVSWLPESWIQTRTVTMNYENIITMIRQRNNHKLTEWSTDYINWAKSLPYIQDFLK